jgi:carbonic anhydrase
MVVHVPAEHKIEGESFDLELQFECYSRVYDTVLYNQSARLSMLFNESSGDSMIRDLILDNNFSMTTGTYEDYYTYTGSATTPTCDVGVNWYVLSDVGDVDQEELDFFNK